MNVYAFYEPINEPWIDQNDQKILIDLWKKSWNYYGWNPVIITLDDAKKHALYEDFYKKIEQFPTVCPKIYDMYCFLRWLSFANYGGWMSAVSVMNHGFTPVDYNEQIVTAHGNRLIVPTTAIHITKNKIQLILDIIMKYEVTPTDTILVNGVDTPHISDMIILNKNFKLSSLIDKMMNISSMYSPNENWQNSLIVHYPVPTIHMYGDRDTHKTRTQVILEDPRWKQIL
jgi:hypothetical protein